MLDQNGTSRLNSFLWEDVGQQIEGKQWIDNWSMCHDGVCGGERNIRDHHFCLLI